MKELETEVTVEDRHEDDLDEDLRLGKASKEKHPTSTWQPRCKHRASDSEFRKVEKNRKEIATEITDTCKSKRYRVYILNVRAST